MVDFATEGHAVKVFTLNYDTCVERACRESGISIVTGFDGEDPHHRGWKPGLLRDPRATGILLHKLHGSLTWFGNDPSMFENLEPPDPSRTKSRYGGRPVLILGPGAKEQPDDPFAWLLHRFHETLKTVQTCVVVGFGGNDPHIAERIGHEQRLGLDVIDVSIEIGRANEPRMKGETHGGYRGVTGRASNALRNGSVADAVVDARRVVIR